MRADVLSFVDLLLQVFHCIATQLFAAERERQLAAAAALKAAAVTQEPCRAGGSRRNMLCLTSPVAA